MPLALPVLCRVPLALPVLCRVPLASPVLSASGGSVRKNSSTVRAGCRRRSSASVLRGLSKNSRPEPSNGSVM